LYDIIGDIHGHAAELVELFELLGYEQRTGVWKHATRKPVFVGDFIDRGPQIAEVLTLVRPMCESGNALAVMGNHEFNALAYHTPDPTNPGGYLREHSTKNTHQHAATLNQLTADELKSHLEWFRQLPMWLELEGLRVVHACWDSEQMSVISQAGQRYGGVSAAFLGDASTPGSTLFLAIEDVLKGKEINLPDGVSYDDKDGHPRTTMRVKWFRSPENETLASYALSAEGGLAETRLPASVGESITPYPCDADPVFFGHYWLRADRPARLAANVACVDYSVAKGGSLCAYRWDGERELSNENFCFVRSRS